MSSDDFGKSYSEVQGKKESEHGGHPVMFGGLILALAVALGGNVYLWNRSDQMGAQLKTMQNTTQQQIARLSEATTTILDQRLDALNKDFETAMKSTKDNASVALSKARLEAAQQSKALTSKIEEERQQLAEQLAQIHDTAAAAESKISDVSAKVSNVSMDVNSVRADVVNTQSGLQKTGADLARVTGDLGVLSGLIATNSKELAALRQLGERNYFEFSLNRSDANKKVNNIGLTLKKTDPKKNRYTVEILADDKRLEKKDKTINEPVQLMLAGNTQPYEIVVNRVDKDQIVGYLSTPKVAAKRQP